MREVEVKDPESTYKMLETLGWHQVVELLRTSMTKSIKNFKTKCRSLKLNF